MRDRVYDPRVTELERELSGVAAMIHRIDSCQAWPYPQDDVVGSLRKIFRATAKTIEHLRNAEEVS